jgi:hypothetical protein
VFLACRYGPCEAEALKERMKRAVALLGEEEVQSIMEQEGKIEVSAWPQWPLLLSTQRLSRCLTQLIVATCLPVWRGRSLSA